MCGCLNEHGLHAGSIGKIFEEFMVIEKNIVYNTK
jgi:hypothetical protein